MKVRKKTSRSALCVCLCLVAVVAFLQPACGPIARPAPDFEGVSRDYMQRLRWKDVNGASRHYADEYREEFRRRFGIADLHVVDIRMEAVELRPEPGRAETLIVLDYYLLPSASVRQLELRQQWVLQGGDRVRAGVWRVVTPFPAVPCAK